MRQGLIFFVFVVLVLGSRPGVRKWVGEKVSHVRDGFVTLIKGPENVPPLPWELEKQTYDAYMNHRFPTPVRLVEIEATYDDGLIPSLQPMPKKWVLIDGSIEPHPITGGFTVNADDGFGGIAYRAAHWSEGTLDTRREACEWLDAHSPSTKVVFFHDSVANVDCRYWRRPRGRER